MKNNYSAGFNTGIFNKSMTLFSLLLLMSLSLKAQDRGKQESTRITSSNYLEQLLQKKTTSEYVITSEHISSSSGIKHTYVRQAINGMEVCGTESSLHTDVTGKTVVAHVNFVKEIGASVKNSSASITAEQAISRVAQQMNYSLSNLAQIESPSGINQKGLYNGAGISGTDIPVKLMYYYQEGIGTHLVWELSVMEKDTPDWWNFRVDASSGTIIDKDNWTVSCNVMGDHSEEGHKAMAKNKVAKIAKKKSATPIHTVLEENSVMVQTYNVFALPKEDPYDGPRSLEVNPANATASQLGWHDDGTTSYTYTKGNNVSAYDDGNNDNSGSIADHTPESAPGLIFNYAFDATEPGGNPIYSAAAQSEDAAITNLFYWNNIIHDVMYQYGFNEASGNFQENNFANGGAGGDSVDAQAQDSANLTATNLNRCNANFSTPTDGGNPRMQMYICDGGATPDHNDGDFDNNVIVHEYAHGISNRLVGGPGVGGTLSNMEQMGEGWSDFYGYMLTMNSTNATSDRAIGNFLFDQGPAGGGIRPAPYSTNLTTNPWTYAGVANTGSISRPHGIGFIWSSMLYEMTQALIARDGFDADLYTGTGGNNTAIALVTEGLKLTPPSPGFVDGRDAILAADLALNAGANCGLIWRAFAKRGLGLSASQGSSASRTDGVEAFDLPVDVASFDTLATVCVTSGIQMGLSGGSPAGGTYSGTGVTDNGDGTYDFDPTLGGAGDAIVTYAVISPCSGLIESLSDTIVVTDGFPVFVCQDATVTLDGGGNATLLESDIINTESSLTTTFAGGNGQAGNMFDVMAVNDITIDSFDISMDAGVTADVEVYFKTGSWVGSDTTPGDWTLVASPTGVMSTGQNSPTPLNLDLDIDVAASNTVAFYVTLVNNAGINYTNGTTVGSLFASDANLQMFEGVGKTYPFGSTFTPRNFNGNIIYRKIGDVELPDNCGNSVAISLSQTTFTCNDIGDVTVTVTGDDGNGGITTCEATVTVVGPTSTYNMPVLGGWDVLPDAGRKVLFQSNYNTSTADITACSCEVASGSTLTVDAGGFLDITGNIKVGAGSTLLVEHEGSVRQISDDATVTNDGTINVLVDTPLLDGLDFMLLGSPMTTETSAGVFTDALRVRNHLTGNFTLNTDVGAGSPGAGNWVDEEGDDWPVYNGGITPGEGYMVMRSLIGPPTALNLIYTQGTLNNGVITYAAGYNGTQNGSPNVIANPYASAISATDLINGNANVDAVYFWEHITAPNSGIPGPYGLDYTMEDISIFNLTGGTSAAGSDPGTSTTPNGIISTAQGFGVKVMSAGPSTVPITFNNAMRRTTGNTTLRNLDLDRIWVNVQSEGYELNSTALVGFIQEATDAVDIGYDAKRLATNVSLYSHLDDGTDQLGIQARGAFDENVKIPMGFATLIDEQMNYKISIQNIEGLNLGSATVYLIDNIANSITNLSNEDYTFESKKGIFDGRFTLQFTPEGSLGINDSNLDSVSLYPNPTQNIVTIVSPQAIVTSATIYDIRGRIVSVVDFRNTSNYQIDLSNVEAALYFVEIITESGIVTKRVLKK